MSKLFLVIWFIVLKVSVVQTIASENTLVDDYKNASMTRTSYFLVATNFCFGIQYLL